LRQQLDSLPALTRQDLLNSQKGAYAASMTRVLAEAQNRTLQQAVKIGQLTYRPATNLVLYGFFAPWMRHRATVEELLYELNPARVSEAKVMVPMRDGIKLSALLYRNSASTAKVPVVVLLSPYPNGGEARQGNIYATNGYNFLYVDTRGRRGSGGYVGRLLPGLCAVAGHPAAVPPPGPQGH
jgi:predicted acyl esterase